MWRAQTLQPIRPKLPLSQLVVTAPTKTLVSYTYYNHVMWRTQTLQPIRPKLPLSQLVVTAATKTLISYTHYNHVMWRTLTLQPIRPKLPLSRNSKDRIWNLSWIYLFVSSFSLFKVPAVTKIHIFLIALDAP